MSTNSQAMYISKHAAMQDHSDGYAARQLVMFWGEHPVKQMNITTRTRMYNTAANVGEAVGRRCWNRQRLASEATLDIRTVDRIYAAQPVQQRSLQRVAVALGFMHWRELTFPHDKFMSRLDDVMAREERAAVTPTIEHAAERAPWWRRLLSRIWR